MAVKTNDPISLFASQDEIPQAAAPAPRFMEQSGQARLLAVDDEHFNGVGSIDFGLTTQATYRNWTFTAGGTTTDMALADQSAGLPTVLTYDEGDPADGAMVINYKLALGVHDYVMRSADGSGFKLESFRLGQIPDAAPQLSISAYRHGEKVFDWEAVDLRQSDAVGKIVYTLGLDDPANGRYGTLSFNGSHDFDDIDEIRFAFGGDTELQIDDIDISPAISDVTPPVFAGASVNGKTLVMRYTDDGTLDAANAPLPGSFVVTAGGAGMAVSSVSVDAAARTVTLTLASAVAAGQSVSVSYADPSAGDDIRAIQDAAGNDAATLPPTAVVNDTVDLTAPAVIGVTVPAAKSYAAGQTLSFTVGFDENITVTGTDSSLALFIGGSSVAASFAGKTGNTITYSYTVQAGDNDADGIAVGALTLGATTIRDAAGNHASLTLNNVGNTGAVLVDTLAPAVVGTIAAPADGSYRAGRELSFTVTFDEDVTLSGTDSTLGLDIGGQIRSAAYASHTARSITYTYTVQAGDTDADGIGIGAIALGASTLRDGAGNAANPSLAGHLPVAAAILVDTAAPAVAGTVAGPADKLYIVGQTLSFTVAFDENVDVQGGAATGLVLDIGGVAREAGFAMRTANSITYTYTVQAGDNDGDGIAVTSLALHGGTIRDAAGNDASLALAGHLPQLAGVLVDGGPPAVAGSVSVPSDGVYGVGQPLSFTISFDEDVIVEGSDSTLGLVVGGATRTAAFASSTAHSITYTYTVQAGDTDADGISITSIALGATTIRDAAGNDAVLALAGHLPSTAGILVDTAAPAVSGVSAPANDTYVAGQTLDFTVSFDQDVSVTGVDSTLALTVGASLRHAAFLSSSGGTVTYRYIVQPGDIDADGIELGAIDLGTSSIRDGAGNAADLDLAGHLPSTAGVLVDGSVPAVSGTIAAPAARSYTVGQTLSFTVTFDENVDVVGTDSSLALDIGGSARTAGFASKTANSVSYTYTVQAGDQDGDGITVGAIVLGATTIRDAAGNDAKLDLAGHLPSLAAVLVDTAAPALASARIDGDTLVLAYADAGLLDAAHAPPAGAFAVTLAGASVAVLAVTVNPATGTVTLKLATAATHGQAVTVAYTDPGAGDDADAIQDVAGNDAASLAPTAVVNATPAPPPPTPPSSGTTIDGVVVKTGTVVRADGSVAEVISIPVVTPSRQEQVGNNDVADIPLVKGAGGASLLAVQVPVGLGLEASGAGAPRPAGDSLADLIREIKAHTASGSHDQAQLTGGGGGFLDGLADDTPLLVQTIVVSGNGGNDGTSLGIIGQVQGAGAVQSALVIDTRGLAGGVHLELQNVEFAAVIGAARITGGTGAQHVWGDGASQDIFLGADDDVLHGGAGNDTVGSAGGNDMIYGDEGDDLVFGGAGDDYLDGGSGRDTARFAGRSDGYALRVKDGVVVLTDRAGAEGSDTVAAVEVLRFAGGQGMADEEVLARLYEGLLQRAANGAELAYWQDQHARGVSMHDIGAAILGSAEGAQLHGAAGDAAFVAGLYQSVLGRAPAGAEAQYWTGLLATGADRATIALGFTNSAEKLGASHDLEVDHSELAVLLRMYHAMFGRAPDEPGLNFWLARHEDGMSLGAIADAFVASAEAGGLLHGGGDGAFVDLLYQTALERAPGVAEKTLVLDQLQHGVFDRGQVLLNVAESAESAAIVGSIDTSIGTV